MLGYMTTTVKTPLSKMSPDFKAAWLAALRSGKYLQGKHLLKYAPKDSYCCLGVLCDLVDSNKWFAVASGSVAYAIPGTICLPPASVLEQTGVDRDACGILTDKNDRGESFAIIANWIEENL